MDISKLKTDSCYEKRRKERKVSFLNYFSIFNLTTRLLRMWLTPLGYCVFCPLQKGWDVRFKLKCYINWTKSASQGTESLTPKVHNDITETVCMSTSFILGSKWVDPWSLGPNQGLPLFLPPFSFNNGPYGDPPENQNVKKNRGCAY